MKHRILVIDDNPAIHDDFRKILLGPDPLSDAIASEEALLFGDAKREEAVVSFEMDSALQGRDGLELLRKSLLAQQPYALAFIDVRMPPGWDGIETITRLWELYPELQIVICTAYSDYSWNDITRRFGHSDNILVLKKPFDALAVLQMSHALVKKWFLAQQSKSQLQNLGQMVAELQVANRKLTHEMAERIHAEKQLRLSEERFAKAFNSSPVPMCIQSLEDQRFVDVNASYLKMTGYSRDDLLGRSAGTLDIWPDVGQRKKLSDQLADAKSIRNVETKVRAKDGSERTTLLSAEVIMLNGEWFALVSEHDITERLALESALRQAQKMDAVGQLAAGVAHDFNNLLTIIQGNVSLLLTRHQLEGSVQLPLKETLAASERAGNLTRQLLAFSRKQPVQLKAINLTRMFEHIGPLLQRLIGEQVQVEFHLAKELPPVHADPCNLEQVIINLAVNARDAMPKGGKLTFSAASESISEGQAAVKARARAGDFICLKVRDTGCGMDAATQARIFEPFFTTKPVGKGTGLGLATVYAIVKQHQGWIDLESEVGSGTAFSVYLPVSREPTETSLIRNADIEPASCEGNETILVVEDEEFVRQFVQTVLESSGYKPLLAANAAEALRIWNCHAHEISLLLTDMVMPGGVTGRELAEKLTEQKPDLKVVFSSGYALDLLSDNAALPPGYAILQKPYRAQVLAATVRKCLDRQNTPGGVVGREQRTADAA